MALNIKEIEYEKNEYMESLLKLNISGKDVHYETMNSLRKICINQIPAYAFNQANIRILKNKSVFDDTYMRHRLSLMTIRDLDINDNNLRIEYYGSFENKDNLEHENFTENHVVKNNDDKHNATVLENPATIIQLNLTQLFEFSMFAVKDVGEHNAIFNTAHVYYGYDENNVFDFTVESCGQYHEYDILLKGCELLCEKFVIVKNTIRESENTVILENKKIMILNIDNEDLTTFGPIKYFLLQSKNVVFAGVGRYAGYLVKNALLKLKTADNVNPYEEIYKAIDLCVEFYENFKNTLLLTKNKEIIKFYDNYDKAKEKVNEKVIKKKTKK